MQTPSTLRLEDNDAITTAIAKFITARLCRFDERLNQAYVRHLAHEAIAAGRDIETLTVRIADAVRSILGDKIGAELANATRLSGDALASHDGHRRWLHTAHKSALNAFHLTAEDYRAGKASELDLFLAQVALTGIAKARGLLGIPIEVSETRKMRNVRTFDPTDYPASDVRAAIVEAVFNGDHTSMSLIRSRAGHLPDDDKGQITVLLDALEGPNEVMRRSLAALAGQIIAEDRRHFAVEGRRRSDFIAMARELASTLRPYRSS